MEERAVRYVAALVVLVVLSGCDRSGGDFGSEANGGAADSGAAQAPAPPKSETLKITYSKADPYGAAETMPKAMAPGMHMHDSAKPNEKMGSEKKPEHQEHPQK